MTAPVMLCGDITSVNLVYVRVLSVVRTTGGWAVDAWFELTDNNPDIDEGVRLKNFTTMKKAREWLQKVQVKQLEVTYQREGR